MRYELSNRLSLTTELRDPQTALLPPRLNRSVKCMGWVPPSQAYTLVRAAE